MKSIKKIILAGIVLIPFIWLFNVRWEHDVLRSSHDGDLHGSTSILASVVSNCSSENLSQDVVPVLEQCRIDCGAQCQYCGQVYTFCLEGGFLGTNFTQDACNIAFLDYVPVSSSCPFLDSLERCCNSTVPVPPLEPVGLECTNQTNLELVYERLVFCQQDCGSRCTICGQVWNYCKESDRLERSLNYTVEACAILTLDSIPTSDGLCPFNTTLESCCFEQPTPPVTPPVAPPVEPPVTPLAPPVTPIAPPVTPPVAPPVAPTCTTVPTIACSSSVDCPKYFACDGTRCQNNQGLSCSNGITCQSNNCTAAPSCFCGPTYNSSQLCLDATCVTNTCGSFQCYPGTGCSASLGPCTSSSQCGGPKPYCVNGYCHDYSCLDNACRDVDIPYCNLATPCPVNSVCDNTAGSYCVGSVGGQCTSDGDCNAAYDCLGCTCQYTASGAIQDVVFPTCDNIQLITCGTSFSFALQESIVSPYGLTCSTLNLNAGYPVAFFRVQGTIGTTVNIDLSAQYNLTAPVAATFLTCTGNQLFDCLTDTSIDNTGSFSYSANSPRSVVVWYPATEFQTSLGAIVDVTVTCT